MPRRRRRRASRNSRRVSFTTRRGRRVSFVRTGRGHRKTAWNRFFGKVAKGCRRRHKPFTKGYGTCMKKGLKRYRRSGR